MTTTRFPRQDDHAAPTASPVGPEAPERGSLRVNVYIDGFNLYYGCLKGTPYRWLDVSLLARRLLDAVFPSYQLNLIRYFTARVQNRGPGSRSAQRQDVYLRALATLPNLTIHYGQFKTNPRSLPLAAGGGFATVLRSEEKGSDVNLASYLVIDAVDGCYDVALVVSNDTDLVLPIALTRQRFAVAIGVAAPCYFRNRRPMLELEEVSDFTSHVLPSHRSWLQESQFPDRVPTAGRGVHRPDAWA